MTAVPRNRRSALDFLSSTGEMGETIRAFDWGSHPLGDPTNWPQSLKTSVSLILNSQHPMWIGWGREMSFLYNDAYLHVLGMAKHPWALGRPASEVWAEIWDVCGPLADKVFREGKATFVDDVRLFMNRGHFLEETYYSFSYSPIRDETGGVGGLFCPSNDVSPKVIGARRLLTLSELAANALLERTTKAACAAAMATLAKNPDDIPFALLYVVEQETSRAVLEATAILRDGEEASAPAVVDLSSEPSGGVWPLAEVFSDGEARHVPVEHLRKLPHGAADQPVSEAVVVPVSSGRVGKPIGMLIVAVNPTRHLDNDYQAFIRLVAGNISTAIQNARAAEQEKRRADALAELDRAKTQFFSNVSHEFRTPLTLMLGPLEAVLSHQDAIPPEERAQLETVHRNSLRLLKLVNSLLDFSRIEAGRIKAAFQPTDLAMLTADLASNFRSAMESEGLELMVDCDALPESVYVDRDMWEKIVLNLLSNAFKFTFDGRIIVRLRADAGAAVLTVSDTGTGIPEAELPKIFERFHRVEGAKGRTYEGSGIGLALIREFVKMHGGEVAAVSRVGEGSAFTVRVPFGVSHLHREQVIDTEAAAGPTALRPQIYTSEASTWMARDFLLHAAEEQPESEANTGIRPRVLLADDNADMREHIARILAGEYDLVAVADGEAALEEAKRTRPDLVLSDVMMPKLDGFGLLNALRADPRMLYVPFIMLSARAGEEARTGGMEAGADDYLTKPFSSRELLTRIAAHLKLAKVRREANERERVAREEADALNNVSRVLGSELDLQKLVQTVTDIATKLTGAQFGAFFYNVLNEQGESYMLYTLSGASRESFEKFGMMPRNTPVFHTTFSGLGPRRSANIRKDADYGQIAPHFGMPKGHLPVTSYLAVPVKSRSGEVLGGLFFGHSEPGIFNESAERLAMGIATHAAIGIDNARLYQQAEQQARASQLLASIVGSSEDAILSKDINGVITSWNASAQHLFGYTAQEAVGKTVAELLVPPDRQEEEPDILARLRRGERVEHFETVRQRKDGTQLDVSLTISPMRDDQGRIVGASKIARDISQQVKAREAIQSLNEQLGRELGAMTRLQQLSARIAQSGELHPLLEDVLGTAIDIVDADMGNIQLFRNGKLRIVCQRGFKAPFLDFFNSVQHRRGVCDIALGRGERVIVEDVRESPILANTQEMKVILEAGVRSIQATPLISRSGQVLGMLSTHYREPHGFSERELRLLDLLARQAADLIESTLSAEALRESEEQFRQLAEVGPQMVWLSGPHGELQFVNRRWVEFSGFDFEATKDPERLSTRLHPGDRILDHWRNSVETGTPFELEARLRGRDGEFRWFMMRSVPVRDEQGRIVRWFGASTDIHENKTLQLDLKRANQDLEQFAYSASHDLQEPIRGVKLFSQLLAARSGDKLDNQSLEFLGNVQESAGRMEILVRDLLAYTKASTGETATEFVDANVILQTAVANLASAIAENEASIRFDPLPSVRIHATQLQQLFQNLVSNGIKYHRSGVPPVVHISAASRNGNQVFSVTDNGIGIEPEYQEKIFGLFKRLHTGDEYSGTGIGLALCQRIVERHGGRIWVESEPGKGSTFHFSLPV